MLALGEGILVQDAHGVVLECNEAAERVLAYPARGSVGHGTPDRSETAVGQDGAPLPNSVHPTVTTLATGRPAGAR